MPCHQPLPAWRDQHGTILLTNANKDPPQYHLPCGKCTGCRKSQAQMWALRCRLELSQHPTATFTTLTYDEKYQPVTLRKLHLANFIKRLREHTARKYKPTPNGPFRLRFFATGEYGEKHGRPHYHAILYGVDPADAQTLIDTTWGMGITRNYPVTYDGINYVARYTAKKYGDRTHARHERVDETTGEVYHWQPPFIQMSRVPGIAAHARAYTASWRDFAIMDGYRLPVPRYFHNAWKQQATEEEKQQLLEEKEIRNSNNQNNTLYHREAAEKIARAQLQLSASRRKL